MDDLAELEWRDQALCAQTDPEAFFPEKGGSTTAAKRVCRACDVRAECLEFALENDERFGIWGGMSERERRRLKRPKQGPRMCGSGRHVMDEKNAYVNPKTGWQACRACKNANKRRADAQRGAGSESSPQPVKAVA
jgi:WhiB family redox-sensing transcriptional regulator